MSSTEATNASRPMWPSGSPRADGPTPERSTRARDGSALWWGGADTPGPPQVVSVGTAASVAVAVAPMRPGHSVAVEYRINRGPIREAIGLVEPRVHGAGARIFRALVPGQPDGLVEFLPVLRFAGQPISPRLSESADPPHYRVGCGARPVEIERVAPVRGVGAAVTPSWDWDARFLGSCTILLRKDVIGVLPDGLRIAWRFVEAHLAGPVLDGAFLPGSADWMRIRPDGVGIVEVQGCIETRTGSRIYTSYGGVVDLGPDGYARAMHGESDPFPAFVGAPTYATDDEGLEWLNRAQCLVVGRVDMKALRVEYDAYLVEVRGRRSSARPFESVGEV